jgi:hypothetical protein
VTRRSVNAIWSKIFLISLLVILLISSSGCIHVDLGNPFKEPEPEVTDFRIITKEGFPLTHVFNFEEDSDIRHSDTQPFYVKKDTEWVNISIIVIINNYEFLNNSPLNISFLEQYVRVTLTGPNEEIYYSNKFTESAELLRPLDAPESGRWIVAVEAKGFGYQGNYDSYTINVVAYEPE